MDTRIPFVESLAESAVTKMNEVCKKDINTIYIISKGRPKCTTAKTLTRLNYPGEWYIVCGNNDETLDEYKKLWRDRVIVFDWFDEITRTDTLDNFGFESMPSGACPVRNATMEISHDRGELRHWQFDDDYTTFSKTFIKNGKPTNLSIKDGKELEEILFLIAKFGYETSLPNVGFTLTSCTYPYDFAKFQSRVFNAHNMPSKHELFQRWRGRLNDDTVNALDIYRKGGFELSFMCVGLVTKETQTEKGGLTEFYKAVGTVRKTAYAMLICPSHARLTVKFGRFHHDVRWSKIRPCIIRDEWKRY